MYKYIYLTRENIVDNTKVLCRQNETFRLLIHEGILIKFKIPTGSRQDTGNTRILNYMLKITLLNSVTHSLLSVDDCISMKRCFAIWLCELWIFS